MLPRQCNSAHIYSRIAVASFFPLPALVMSSTAVMTRTTPGTINTPGSDKPKSKPVIPPTFMLVILVILLIAALGAVGVAIYRHFHPRPPTDYQTAAQNTAKNTGTGVGGGVGTIIVAFLLYKYITSSESGAKHSK